MHFYASSTEPIKKGVVVMAVLRKQYGEWRNEMTTDAFWGCNVKVFVTTIITASLHFELVSQWKSNEHLLLNAWSFYLSLYDAGDFFRY